MRLGTLNATNVSFPSAVESIVFLSHLVVMLYWLVLVAVVNRVLPAWLLLSVASMYFRFNYAKVMVLVTSK